MVHMQPDGSITTAATDDPRFVDKADAWDAIAAKNAEIAALRAELAQVKAQRDRYDADAIVAKRMVRELTDAQNALVKDARRKALQEAADCCDPTSYHAHHASVRRRCRDAILARIEAEQ